MAMDGSHDNKLLEEGRSLANESNAMFVCNNGEALPSKDIAQCILQAEPPCLTLNKHQRKGVEFEPVI